jgi:hypothetical protein
MPAQMIEEICVVPKGGRIGAALISLYNGAWRFLRGGDAMAKLALIYGMRLLPVDDLGEVQEANVVLKNGRTARVSMHLIEGSKEEIEKTFRQSIDAFFELYPEI